MIRTCSSGNENCRLLVSVGFRMLRRVYKRWAAEIFGTFSLVFAGTGAIVINDVSGGTIGHAGIALTFGMVVLAMIYAVGDVSGAHLNPAVTAGFCAAKRMPWSEAPGYMGAQLVGGFLASGFLKLLFPAHENLGATLPAGPVMQSFWLEIALTTILMLVVLNVSTGAKEKGITAGIAVGSVIAFEAMFAGPICGASMNPVRSIAPAVVSGDVQHLWAYIAAPVIGALIAVPACVCIQPKGCCAASVTQT